MERRLTKRSEKSYNQQTGCPVSNRTLQRQTMIFCSAIFHLIKQDLAWRIVKNAIRRPSSLGPNLAIIEF
ncbi:hypothetical protein [Roseovarius sp. Pro17]|uniref:hypothetical protein n=1 Tax=Roseovarius sp. Pro17 TaxID=3108175 RepID=UPI002D785991|nr:hypothetical protein [Roseovarius sp. Pro17]